MRKYVLSLCWVTALLMTGCTHQRERVMLTGQEPFREGDLVLRCGYGMESKAVTEASQSVYSHIGMLHQDEEKGCWMVIHAVPGEAEPDAPELLKCEPVGQFFAPERAIRGAWMRVRCSDSVAAAAARDALQKVAEKVAFDNDYLLSDTTRLYCTELVCLAYRHQGVDLAEGRQHEVPQLFCKEGWCIFPCDIETSSKILFVKPFNTTSQ